MAAEPVASQQVRCSSHPLVLAKLSELRDKRTVAARFRQLVKEITWLLAYEALADAPVQKRSVVTPVGRAAGAVLGPRIGLMPVLRAGLGMAEALSDLLPEASIWHLGMYRNEETHRPVIYYNRLPHSPPVDLALLLDPMLATAGSAVAAVDMLKEKGIERVLYLGLIAAQAGVDHLTAAHPDVRIHVAAIDRDLNDHAFIIPGLGDAGDRQFGTR